MLLSLMNVNFSFLVANSNSIRDFVHPSVHPSVHPWVRRSRVSRKLQNQVNSSKFNKIQQNSTKLKKIQQNSRLFTTVGQVTALFKS